MNYDEPASIEWSLLTEQISQLKEGKEVENITLGQVALALAFLVGFISSIKYLKNDINKTIAKILSPINEKVGQLELNTLKTDLTNFMSLAENNNITYEQKANAYELYDRYCKLGGNSYIHNKWEKLVKEGKI